MSRVRKPAASSAAMAVFVASLMVAIPATAAERDGVSSPIPGPADLSDYPSQAGLTDQSDGEVGTQAVEYSPAGCEGSTDWAHPSTHYPDTVNVRGRTQCDAQVANLYLEIRLERFRGGNDRQSTWNLQHSHRRKTSSRTPLTIARPPHTHTGGVPTINQRSRRGHIMLRP